MSSKVDPRLRPETGGSSSLDELLRRIADGDRGAFAQLYDRLGTAILRLAHALRSTDLEAEALAFDVLIGVWREAPLFPRQELDAEGWTRALVSRLLSGAGREAGRRRRRSAPRGSLT